MSEISSTASTSSTASGSAAQRPGHGGSRQGPANLFSSLLSMVSASGAQPLSDGLSRVSGMPGELPTDATGTGTDDHPLSGLLGWMDQAQDRGPLSAWASLSSLSPDSSDTATTTTTATDLPAGTPLLPDTSAVATAMAMAVPLSGPAPAANSNNNITTTTHADGSSSAAAARAPAAALPASVLTSCSAQATPGTTLPATTTRIGSSGIEMAGMRPVAPGTTLTPAEAASLAARSSGASTTGTEPTGARATPATPAAAASAPVPTQAVTQAVTQALTQPLAAPSPAMASAPAQVASGVQPARPSEHGRRSAGSSASTSAPTAATQPGTAPPMATSDTGGPGTASPAPSPTSPVAGKRAASGAPERASGKQPTPSSSERSTVALDERFARTQAETAAWRDARTEGLAPPATGLAGADGSAPGRNDLAHPAAASQALDNTRLSDALGTSDPAGLPPDAEPASVSHWSIQHLRHASLRVGEGSQDAIDIQLSMDGQELNVDFRTDSAEARATLIQQADQSLGSLLERSGIQLGGVSVGAQHQHGQPSPRQAPQGETTPSGPAGTAQDSGPPAPGAAPRGQLAARQDNSRPLDLFV